VQNLRYFYMYRPQVQQCLSTGSPPRPSLSFLTPCVGCAVFGTCLIAFGSLNFASIHCTSPSNDHPLTPIVFGFVLKSGYQLNRFPMCHHLNPSHPLAQLHPSSPNGTYPPINSLCFYSPLFCVVQTCLASRSLVSHFTPFLV